MLAATEPREIGAGAGGPGTSGGPIARRVFKAAYRELCARIWLELELLAQSAARFAGSAPPRLAMSTAILRLELVVLVDSCRSPNWRCMLSVEQRDSLGSLLTDVLAALYVDSEHLCMGIADAQDRVLEELVPQPETGPAPADSVSACEGGMQANAAVHELVTLIEAKAAARFRGGHDTPAG